MMRFHSRKITNWVRTWLAVVLMTAQVPAQAVIVNGAPAIDVFGQTSTQTTDTTLSYTKNSPSNGPGLLGLQGPSGIAVDTVNHRLFVADSGNARILVYNLNSSNILVDKTPDYVLGQPDFNSFDPTLPTAQNRTSFPENIAFDSVNNRLYVADSGDSRVLVFNTTTITNGMNAAYVIGKPDFTSAGWNTSQSGLASPTSVALDTTNNRLFVADNMNSRVMIFNTASLSNGMNASNELGQPSGGSAFTSSSTATTQSRMNRPTGVAYDSVNNQLFVADHDNNRILVYSTASITNGMNAAKVLGQTTFTGSTGNATQNGLSAPYHLSYDSTNSRLFATDNGGRVMVYSTGTVTNGMNASYVLCVDGGFTSNNGASTSQTTCGAAKGVTYDSSTNLVYVANNWGHRVDILNVAPTGSTVSMVSQGGQQACAIVTGKLYCWGNNQNGALGIGYDTTWGPSYTRDYWVPVQVGSATNWTYVSSGWNEDNCGIAGGKLYCWGKNQYGALGTGDTTTRYTPQQIGTDTTWTAVSTSGHDTCGINAGKLYCWGYNDYGQVGVGDTANHFTPQQVGSLTNWTAVSTGGTTTCGIESGHLYCWGANANGEGATANMAFVTSTTYNGNLGGITGANLKCATQAVAGGLTGTYLAWTAVTTNTNDPNVTFSKPEVPYVQKNGVMVANGYGGTTGFSKLLALPTNALQVDETGATQTGAAWTNTVATTGKASTSGNSTTNNCASWTSSLNTNSGKEGTIGLTTASWSFVSTMTCDTLNHLYCFQQDAVRGPTTPTLVGTFSSSWTAVSNNWDDMCAIAGGQLYCTGRNAGGEFGLNNTTKYGALQAVGTAITTTGWQAVTVATGSTSGNMCAIANGALYCQGTGAAGANGAGNTTQYKVFHQVGTDTTWTSVTNSLVYDTGVACGIDNGKLYCWGGQAYQLGISSTVQVNAPAQVSFDSIGNGPRIQDEIGQYTSISSTATPHWTKSLPNNGNAATGLYNPGGISIDPVHHWLYVANDSFYQGFDAHAIPLNGDNSISSASGGHTALYTINGTGFDYECTTCNGTGIPKKVFKVEPDPVNNRLFQLTETYVAIVDATTVGFAMLPYAGFGVPGNGSAGQNTFSPWVGDAVYDPVNQRLFVGDNGYNRILVFDANPSTMTNSENASYVIGQLNFTDTGSATTQNGLNMATGALAFDKVNQRLFVADQGNNRVLVFNVDPSVMANGMNAAYELGQPAGGTAFTSNGNGTTQSALNDPAGLAFDPNTQRLFVQEGWNCRITVFNVAPAFMANGMKATNVIAQPDFTTACGPTVSASTISASDGRLAYDPTTGKLYYSDSNNNRVLVFEASAVPSQF